MEDLLDAQNIDAVVQAIELASENVCNEIGWACLAIVLTGIAGIIFNMIKR
jgi:hypothetical protein